MTTSHPAHQPPAQNSEPPGAGQAVRTPQARASWLLTLRRLGHDTTAVLSVIIIVLMVAFALAAPLIAAWTGHGATEQFRETGLSPTGIPVGPSTEYLLGTDQLGRDVFVRLAYGARISLLVGVAASLVASCIGILVGMIAGFFGGITDTILSRGIDLVMSVPFLLVAIATVSVVGPSLGLSVVIIVFFSWTGLGRVVRGEVLAIRRREYIEASRSLGESRTSIMFRNVLPNLVVPIVVYTTLMIPAAIVFEATLSFLGLGIVPPTPSWGNMLSEASNGSIYMVAPWMVLAPGLALLALTLAFNLLGDSLRDALDPTTAKVRQS